MSANDTRVDYAHCTFQVLWIGKPPLDVVICNWRAISQGLTNTRYLTHLLAEPLPRLVVNDITVLAQRMSCLHRSAPRE